MFLRSGLRIIFLTCLLTVFGKISFSQSSFYIVFHTDTINNLPSQLNEYSTQKYFSKPEVHEVMNKVSMQMHSLGYLLFNVDSLNFNDSIANVYLFIGDQYSIKNIVIKNDSIFSDLGIKFRFPQLLNQENVRKFEEEIIRSFDQKGYPFSQIIFRNIEIEKEFIKVEIDIQLGKQYIVDTIINKGNLKISNSVLQQLLKTKNGNIFNYSELTEAYVSLAKLDFLTVHKNLQFTIFDNKVIIYTFLNKKETNSLDAILGLISNPDEANKLSFTGSLDLILKNSFGYGESLKLDWLKSESLSQKLNIQINIPFIKKMPFGVTYEFGLLKKDTNFIHIQNIPGLLFTWKTNNQLVFFANIDNSRRIFFPKFIPGKQYSDFNYNAQLFGVKLIFNELDDPFCPLTGYYFSTNTAIGKKNILQNIEINPSAFDSIKLTTTKVLMMANFSIVKQFLKFPILKFESNFGFIYDQNLSESELFRLGGFKSFKGFDEESILATSYVLNELELRLPIERYSYFFIFYNKSYVEKKIRSSSSYDWPYSFGGGLNLKTKAGQFSIAYSLGSQFNQPIQFRSSKIHFGYLAKF